MDTRKLLNDALNGHKNLSTIRDLYASDTEFEQVLNHCEGEAIKGNPLACEWKCLDNLQYNYKYSSDGEEILDSIEASSNQVEIDIALQNGSKFAGLLTYLKGKHSNDQSLINQYAQYASVEEEFGYCKPQPAQTETQISSPVQSVPVSSTPYHLALGKERLGEHTLEQIKQKLEQGTLDLASKAWQQGWPEWKLISEVPEIASILASQPPPLPDDGPPPL